MKKLVLSFVFASGLSFGQVKTVTSSDIQWWGYKLAKSESTSNSGKIGLKSGQFVMKGNQVVGGTFVLDMNSIKTTNLTGERATDLDNHLKNGDFFETNKYPTGTYKITSIKNSKLKGFNSLVTGNLTVKGKTGVVSFPANIVNNKGVITLNTNKFSFDRQKYDVAFQSTAKDVVIKDDVDLQLSITAS